MRNDLGNKILIMLTIGIIIVCDFIIIKIGKFKANYKIMYQYHHNGRFKSIIKALYIVIFNKGAHTNPKYFI